MARKIVEVKEPKMATYHNRCREKCSTSVAPTLPAVSTNIGILHCTCRRGKPLNPLTADWLLGVASLAFRELLFNVSGLGWVRPSRQSRLTQADSAIVGRHSAVGPQVHRLTLHALAHVGEQKLILKDAAGEHHGIQAVVAAEGEDGIAQPLRDASLKRARDLVDIAPAQAVLSYRPQQRTKV